MVTITKTGKIREGAHVVEKGRFCLSHDKFEIPNLDIQINLLSRQLEILVSSSGEIYGLEIYIWRKMNTCNTSRMVPGT